MFFANKMKIIFKTDEENQNMSASTSKIKDTSLNDICYEQIKDNFYYGKFGEFRLVKLTKIRDVSMLPNYVKKEIKISINGKDLNE